MFTTIDNLNTTISFPLKVEGLNKSHVVEILDRTAGSKQLSVHMQHEFCSPTYVIHDEPILVLGVISESVNHHFHFQNGLESIFIGHGLSVVKGSDFRKQGYMFHIQQLYRQCQRLQQLGMLDNSVEKKALDFVESTASGNLHGDITIFDYFHIEGLIVAPIKNIGDHLVQLSEIIKSIIPS